MFCLQNHPKYAPIYLNLPSGNKQKVDMRARKPLKTLTF